MRISDWSSDVCSSDLQRRRVEARGNVDHAILDRAVARDEHDERLVRRQGYEGELLQHALIFGHEDEARARRQPRQRRGDRKSTRSELQSLMRISYAVFCLKKNKTRHESYYGLTSLHLTVHHQSHH